MLPGVKVQDINKSVDERGFFAEIMREDWKMLLGQDRIMQSNLSFTYPGTIRAWHRHEKGQVDYLIVLKGTMKICAYDDEEDSPTQKQLSEIIASSEKLQMVRVPGHYWHGTKTLGPKASFTHRAINVPALEPSEASRYLVTRLYDASNPDEQRRPWDD